MPILFKNSIFTGEKFDKATEEGDIAKRIENNINHYLASLK